jgi:diguanylate cyclase (GGDEF)-like protein/PAS domain S-box-containing protein
MINRTDLPDVFESPQSVKSVGWIRHAILSISFVAVYLVLNRPEIILISKLGFTTWFPATGLIFALMLGVNPWYALLACFADSLAGTVIYHQPLFSWTGLVAPITTTGFYAVAAILLKGRLQINPDLRRQQDVVRYTAVTLIAAMGATFCGVTALVLDHSIMPSDFWRSALGWYVGDVIGLLGLAPFLLIHVLPWVRRNMESQSASRRPTVARQVKGPDIVEGVAQAAAIVGVLWAMFGRTLAPHELFYVCFVPIIWVAMRNGIERVTIAILLLDFGIVAALHFYPAAPDVVAKAGLLMLVVSATGLIVGSAVSERQHIGKELKERTVYLNSLTSNSPFGIVALDQTGRIELYNRAFEELFGFEKTNLVGKKLDSLIYGTQTDEHLEFSHRIFEGQTVQGTARRKRNDGNYLDLEIHAVPLIIDGRVRGSYALYKDISDVLKAAQERDEQGEFLKRSLAELQSRTNEMTLLIELSDMLQSCNTLDEAYLVVSQFGAKLFSAQNSGSLSVFKSSRNTLELTASWGACSNLPTSFPPDDCLALRRGKPHWSSALSAGLVCNHFEGNLNADRVLCIPMVAQGDTIGVLQLHVAISSELGMLDENLQITLERVASSAAGQIALSVASLKLREALKEQSIRDPLTGLYNRRYIHDFLDREILRAKRTNGSFALVFTDLDYFKRFNDSFGHDAGDFVLQSFAKALTSHFRGTDIICRYGGEEFALVLPDSTLNDAEMRANDLRAKVKDLTISHRGMALGPITCSIGIAEFPVDGSNAEELLRVADKCLYKAKALGRDRTETVAKLLPSNT